MEPTTPNVTISSLTVERVRTLLEQYDEMLALYELVPSSDPGLRALNATGEKLIQFVRDICK